MRRNSKNGSLLKLLQGLLSLHGEIYLLESHVSVVLMKLGLLTDFHRFGLLLLPHLITPDTYHNSS